MGHMVNPDKNYYGLQRHLDKMVTGAPNSPAFMKILKLLFTPEDAVLAQKMPLGLKSVSYISRSAGIPLDELNDRFTDMAKRGLVVDMMLGRKRFVMLAPVVIGFFEFTFMRARDNYPMKELAELFEEYMFNDSALAHDIFQGQTQIGRSAAREEALPENYSEIMDWERATKIIESTDKVTVSLCACRHHHTHLDSACDAPLETCLSFGKAAEALGGAGIGKFITNQEALKILETCKEHGLAQTVDNVKHNPTYMCNCCGCCCGMMGAIRKFDIKNAIVSSNFIMKIDLDKCKGCGQCETACVVNAIEIKAKDTGEKKKKKWAVLNEELCLGCGVCYNSCKFGALELVPREQRVFTPETVFDKMIAMGIERGKMSSLLFDDPNKVSHRAMERIISTIEKTPPYKAMMAIEPLKSAFFNKLVGGAKQLNKTAAKDMSK